MYKAEHYRLGKIAAGENKPHVEHVARPGSSKCYIETETMSNFNLPIFPFNIIFLHISVLISVPLLFIGPYLKIPFCPLVFLCICNTSSGKTKK